MPVDPNFSRYRPKASNAYQEVNVWTWAMNTCGLAAIGNLQIPITDAEYAATISEICSRAKYQSGQPGAQFIFTVPHINIMHTYRDYLSNRLVRDPRTKVIYEYRNNSHPPGNLVRVYIFHQDLESVDPDKYFPDREKVLTHVQALPAAQPAPSVEQTKTAAKPRRRDARHAAGESIG